MGQVNNFITFRISTDLSFSVWGKGGKGGKGDVASVVKIGYRIH